MENRRTFAHCIYTCLRKLQYVRACFPRPPCVSKRHLIRSYSGKRWVPQRVKSLSTPSTSRLPPRCIVVSIGCIHASFRSRLMRDLNNIRVTARGRQRKKVKGHSALPIDGRTGAKKGFAEIRWRRRGRGRGEGSRRVKKLSSLPSTVRFSMKPDRPRATFSFSEFPWRARNAAAGTTPRRRCKKKALYTATFFLLYIYTRLGAIFLDIRVCIYKCIFFFLLLVQ